MRTITTLIAVCWTRPWLQHAVRDDLLMTCLASYGEICAALTGAGIRANHGLIKVLDHIEVAIVARDV